MEFLVMHFLKPRVTSSLLGSNMLLSILFSDFLKLCYFIN
jgi:hypothetical protein